MQTPAGNEPPAAPLRHGGWPVHKTPRWLFAAGAILHDMTTGIQSCAGGVREWLLALRQIESGASHDLRTAIHIASYGASNCSPANNELLGDLVGYQVHEALASFRLSRAVDGLVTWAFPDAQRAQNDVADVLRAHGATRVAATAKLQRGLRALNAQRAYMNKIMMNAVNATSATGKLPVLPG